MPLTHRSVRALSGVVFALFVWMLTATSLHAATPAAGDATSSGSAAPRPNIIVILSDDMGFSDLGALGGEIQTPVLDGMAREGRVFTQFYNTARCCPSRAALMTGLYSHQAGIGHLIYKTPHIGYGDHLTSDSITIAEALKGAGYATYMAGKWHLSPRSYDPEKDVQYWPTRRGFDKFYGTINGSGSFFDPSTLTRGEKFVSPYGDPEYQPEQFYYTDAISDNAVKFLQDHKATAADKPFFLYVAYTASHWPLHAPEEAIAPYRGKYDAGFEAIHSARAKRLKELGILPEVTDMAPPVGRWDTIKDKKTSAALMETYAAMATRMDEGIGKILDELRRENTLDNTLVIYLQDNGACAEDPYARPRGPQEAAAPMKPEEIQVSDRPMHTRDGKPIRTGHDVFPGPDDTLTAYLEEWANVSNTPFRLYKHFVHEGGISTPLIAYWPAAIRPTSATQIVRTPAHLIDLMPTFLELAGATYPAQRQGVKTKPLAGVSLVPTMTSGTAIHRGKPLFWEHEGNRAVRDGQWKIVAVSEEGAWELYNMETDRAEVHNLAAQHPDIVKRMAQQWDQWAAENRVLPLGGWRDRIRPGAKAPASAPLPEEFTLKQGESRSGAESPNIAGNGIHVEVEVLEGPVEGVLAAQGASFNGWAIYARNGKITFVARMGKEIQTLETNAWAELPFKVEATIEPDPSASATLRTGPNTTKAPFGALFPKNPTQGLSAGFDSETPVGNYPKEYPFQGKLGPVKVKVLKPATKK